MEKQWTSREKNLYVRQLQLGPMANCIYLVGSLDSRECFVVDPAWDLETIRKTAEGDGMTITGAFLTHYHPDHVGGHLWGYDIEGVAEFLEAEKIKAYANKAEVDGVMQVTGLTRSSLVSIDGGERLPIAGIEAYAIHTPGHTPGSQCLLASDALVSGDTLFLTGCGRVDLPGGDADALHRSLTVTLGRLPDETVVFPGHHYDREWSAPLATVKRINPFLHETSNGNSP